MHFMQTQIVVLKLQILPSILETLTEMIHLILMLSLRYILYIAHYCRLGQNTGKK